jgi:hypothetical protein
MFSVIPQPSLFLVSFHTYYSFSYMYILSYPTNIVYLEYKFLSQLNHTSLIARVFINNSYNWSPFQMFLITKLRFSVFILPHRMTVTSTDFLVDFKSSQSSSHLIFITRKTSFIPCVLAHAQP